jgi:hypothetical protein
MSLNNNIDIISKGNQIDYLGRDFAAFKENLINYIKVYFPNTYADFNETSPGMMFVELVSYIGDNLSYYIDDTYKEGLLSHATDPRSVISLSRFLGYTPRVTTPSVVKLALYQLIPAISDGNGDIVPDGRFFLKMEQGATVVSTTSPSVTFTIPASVDFSDQHERVIQVHTQDSVTGDPTLFIVKKYAEAISAEKRVATFQLGSYEAMRKIMLDDTNIVAITDVYDSNGNKYYNVPFLAQDTVFIETPNSEINNTELYQFRDTVPYLLKVIKTPYRFSTYIDDEYRTILQFGYADKSNSELLTPSFKNIGTSPNSYLNTYQQSIDPTNFLRTSTYGISPHNTTITIEYLVGGGVSSNVGANVLRNLRNISFIDDTSQISSVELPLYNSLKRSIAVENELPSVGGRGAETIDEIRQNAMAHFNSQNRAVTASDYKVRTLSLPPKFGGIAKVHAVADGALDNNSPASILASPNSLLEFTDLIKSLISASQSDDFTDTNIQDTVKRFLIGKESFIQERNNPFAVNLYVLGYDSNKKLTSLNNNRAIKENIKTFLNEFRMLTDGVNILDGFIVNIAVEYELVAYPSYNKSDILFKCNSILSDYFNIDRWDFNQYINLSELEVTLASIQGVSSVNYVKIINRVGGGTTDDYSQHRYNINAATKNKIIYPSLDPCIFELKFPSSDIKGKIL